MGKKEGEKTRGERSSQPLEMCGGAEIAAVGSSSTAAPLRRVVFPVNFSSHGKGKGGVGMNRTATATSAPLFFYGSSRVYLLFSPSEMLAHTGPVSTP